MDAERWQQIHRLAADLDDPTSLKALVSECLDEIDLARNHNRGLSEAVRRLRFELAEGVAQNDRRTPFIPQLCDEVVSLKAKLEEANEAAFAAERARDRFREERDILHGEGVALRDAVRRAKVSRDDLKAALRVYADRGSWGLDDWLGPGDPTKPWQTARDALAAEGEVFEDGDPA